MQLIQDGKKIQIEIVAIFLVVMELTWLSYSLPKWFIFLFLFFFLVLRLVTYAPPPPKKKGNTKNHVWLYNLRRLSCSEHAIQSLLNMFLFGVHLWIEGGLSPLHKARKNQKVTLALHPLLVEYETHSLMWDELEIVPVTIFFTNIGICKNIFFTAKANNLFVIKNRIL